MDKAFVLVLIWMCGVLTGVLLSRTGFLKSMSRLRSKSFRQSLGDIERYKLASKISLLIATDNAHDIHTLARAFDRDEMFAKRGIRKPHGGK